MFKIALVLLFPLLSALALPWPMPAAQAQEGPAQEGPVRTLSLTHIPCALKEFAPGTAAAAPATAKDCPPLPSPDTSADTTSAARAGAATHSIPSGVYDVVVTNESVPWPVGIWLRAKDPTQRVLLPTLSLDKMAMGQMTTRRLTLPAGEYLVSCPLNGTQNYILTVTARP